MAELERLEEHRARIEDWLHACFQDCAPRGNLYDAMRYSLCLLYTSPSPRDA